MVVRDDEVFFLMLHRYKVSGLLYCSRDVTNEYLFKQNFSIVAEGCKFYRKIISVSGSFLLIFRWKSFSHCCNTFLSLLIFEHFDAMVKFPIGFTSHEQCNFVKRIYRPHTKCILSQFF